MNYGFSLGVKPDKKVAWERFYFFHFDTNLSVLLFFKP